MTVVIAAIVAGGFAGAVALYRERRIELRSLLVAARVLSSALLEASLSLDVTAEREGITGPRAIDLLRTFQGQNAVIRPWEEHRDVLAAHLPREDWRRVAIAIRYFRLLSALQEEEGADHRSSIFRVSHDLAAASSLLYRYTLRAGWFRNPGRSSDEKLPPFSADLSDGQLVELWHERTAELREGDSS